MTEQPKSRALLAMAAAIKKTKDFLKMAHDACYLQEELDDIETEEERFERLMEDPRAWR